MAMTAWEKRGKKPKQSTEAKGDKHDPVRLAVPSSCPSLVGGLVWDQRSRPTTAIPFLLPPAPLLQTKGQIRSHLRSRPVRLHFKPRGADSALILHLTHPVCLRGEEAGTQSSVHAWLAGPKNPGAVAGAPPAEPHASGELAGARKRQCFLLARCRTSGSWRSRTLAFASCSKWSRGRSRRTAVRRTGRVTH